MTVVLLGPQRFEPTVAEAAHAIGVVGKIALITAGWQEREAEDEDLTEHLGGRTVNLALHKRADAVFDNDPELAKAYRERSVRLRQLQEFYRVRLAYLVEAARVIAQRVASPDVLDEENEASVESLRVLDRFHLARCQKVHTDFWAAYKRDERPVIADQRGEIAELLEGCEAVAIAGGHVATILNRLRLFGISHMLGQRPVLAWSAGAMAVTQRVALFHDFPPHGVSAPQLLDGGLGLVHDVVALPNPEKRLALDDADRVAMYARRFKPARCLVFPRRSWVVCDGDRLRDAHDVRQLKADGTVVPLEEGRP